MTWLEVNSTDNVPSGPRPRPTALIAMVATPLLAKAAAAKYGSASLCPPPPCPTIVTGHPVAGFGEEAEEFEGEWVKVKLHSSPAALRDILKMHGKLTNRMEVTGKDGAPLVPPIDNDGYKQAIDALADTLRDVLSGKIPEETGKVGTEK